MSIFRIKKVPQEANFLWYLSNLVYVVFSFLILIYYLKTIATAVSKLTKADVNASHLFAFAILSTSGF